MSSSPSSSSYSPPSPPPNDLHSLPSRIAPGYAPPEPDASPSSSSSSSSSILPASLSSAIRITRESASRLTGGQVPCARSSLLFGTASGAVITVMGIVAGRKRLSASQWGVGGGLLVSASSWEVCRRNRAAEMRRMRTVIEEHTKKRGSASTSSPSSSATSSALPSSGDIKAASKRAKAQQPQVDAEQEAELPTSKLFASREDRRV